MGGEGGRVAAPANLRLLNGRAPGRDSGGRTVTPPPAFRRLAPNPPSWLDREAKAEWKRVVPGLTRLDLLKPEDRAALATYCTTWSTWVTAARQVRRDGITVVNTSTRKDGTSSSWHSRNPAVAVMENAASALLRFAREFGLTPSSEGELVGDAGRGAQTPLDDADNPFA